MIRNFSQALIAVFLLFTIHSAVAQKVKISLAAQGAMPFGGAADVVNIGFGGGAGVEIFPEESNISYTFSAGTQFFKGVNDAIYQTNSNYTMIPIEVGIKNHFDDEMQEKGFYMMLQLGYIAVHSSIKWNEKDSLGAMHSQYISASHGGFLFSPAVGYQTHRLDFRLCYSLFTITAPYYLFDTSSGTSDMLVIHAAVFLSGNKNINPKPAQ